MSARRVRTRPSAQSYTARLQRRTVPRPRRQAPAWLFAAWLVALLMLCAEAGHLAAAAVEWATSAQRGIFHILAAAVLGFVAVGAYFGPTRLELGLAFGAGVFLPACWLIGTAVAASPYRHYPILAASAVSATEITLAVLVALRFRV